MLSPQKMKTGLLASVVTLILVLNSACGSSPKQDETPTIAVEQNAVQTEASVQTDPPVQTVEAPSPIHAEIQKIAALADEQNSKSAHGNDELKVEVTDPDKALGWLKNGNTRFVKQRLRSDGQSPQDIKRLSSGQKPHSIVLSCSDSRVPPELVFDQKLGEIFVVRTAGQSLDPVALASIEYAVQHLGASNIVVLGHTKCGAVQAAHSTLHGEDAGSVNLNHLVKDIHPRIESFKDKSPTKDYHDESWANVDGVAADLLKRSVVLEQKASSGEIKVRRGLYEMDSGKVDFK